MGRYLVVANQTLGGEGLMDEIRRRVDGGPSSFYIVVPATTTGRGGVPDIARIGETGYSAYTLERAIDEPTDRQRSAEGTTHARLVQLLAQIRDLGAEADGDAGPSDPVAAVESALPDGPYDEILISTLPLGLSRWLQIDAPHRIARRFGLPVSTITAKQ